ncbi:hypothetical protein C8Q74DRAFT_1191763 [Fomes fomentarius]|nr:hypothetical protein C8Q74DRAFT_1191763 [Fomes fomentarius]
MYHRALRNSETVASIASYAYWGRNMPDTPLDLRTVLAFALTCRAFLEPALDQLWRRQLNLFNLIKTLPEDAWEAYDGEFVGPEGQRLRLIRNIRVILPQDWPRFDHYAAKIRWLGYDPRSPGPFGDAPQSLERWRDTGVPLYTLMALCVVRLPFELLPNVRHVRWTTHEFLQGTYSHVYIFLNPPLVSLKLDFTPHPQQAQEDLPAPFPSVLEDDVFIEYTLKAILEQCPNCCHIEIIAPQMEFYHEAVEPFIHSSCAHTMRTLSANVHRWAEDDLVCLAGLRALRKTRIYVGDADCAWMSRALEVLAPERPFANVVDLTLDGVEFECCAAFFILWGTCRLQRLRVDCEKRPGVEVLKNFVATIAACCSTETLRALEIADSAPPPPLSSGDVVASGIGSVPAYADALLLLTEFTALRTFSLDLSDMRWLDDRALSSIVCSWPHLERLYFGSARGWGGHKSALTFVGLASIVRACPQLEGLAASIDATAPISGLEEAAAGSGVKLETMNLLDSYVGDDMGEDPVACASVARHLVVLFPELVRVRAWTKPVNPDVDRDVEMGEEEEMRLPEWLVSAEFWRTVEKQVATYALLRDMDFPMYLS